MNGQFHYNNEEAYLEAEQVKEKAKKNLLKETGFSENEAEELIEDVKDKDITGKHYELASNEVERENERLINTSFSDESLAKIKKIDPEYKFMPHIKDRQLSDLIVKIDALKNLRKLEGEIESQQIKGETTIPSGKLMPRENWLINYFLKIIPNNPDLNSCSFRLDKEEAMEIESDHSKIPANWFNVLTKAIESLDFYINMAKDEINKYPSSLTEIKKNIVEEARKIKKAYILMLPKIEQEMKSHEKDWGDKEKRFEEIKNYLTDQLFRYLYLETTGGHQKIMHKGKLSRWLDDETAGDWLSAWNGTIDKKGERGFAQRYTPQRLEVLKKIAEEFGKMSREKDPYFGLDDEEIQKRQEREKRDKKNIEIREEKIKAIENQLIDEEATREKMKSAGAVPLYLYSENGYVDGAMFAVKDKKTGKFSAFVKTKRDFIPLKGPSSKTVADTPENLTKILKEISYYKDYTDYEEGDIVVEKEEKSSEFTAQDLMNKFNKK